MAVRCVRQFGSIPVKPEDLDDARYWIRGRGRLWELHVNRNGSPFTLDTVHMRYLHVAKFARKQLRAFHVRGFVEGPRFLLLRGARDRKASDAVQSGRAEVER